MRFVKRAQELGFTLTEIETLLDLADGGPDSCETTQHLTTEAFEAFEEPQLTAGREHPVDLPPRRSLVTDVFGLPSRIPGGWWLALLSFAGLGVVVSKVSRQHDSRRLLRQLAVTMRWIGRGTFAILVILGLLRAIAPFAIGFGLIVGVWWLLLQFMDFGLARPVAWILDRDLPGQPVRWLGVALLVVGFHFDLLAS